MSRFEPLIIAASGDRRLAQTGPDEARVIDPEAGVVHPPLPLAKALAMGVWEPVENDPELIARARESFRFLKAPS